MSSNVVLSMPNYLSGRATDGAQYNFNSRSQPRWKVWRKRAGFWANRLVLKSTLISMHLLTAVFSSPKILIGLVVFLLIVYFTTVPSMEPSLSLDPPVQQGPPQSPAPVSSPGTVVKPTSKPIVVVDAGSSGTRIHLYNWEWPADTTILLPVLNEQLSPNDKPFNSTEPGLSSHVNNVTGINPYLDKLFESLHKKIRETERPSVPVYFYATAGMRQILAEKQVEIMKTVEDYLDANGFITRNVKVITGNDEGKFGWIAANYLKGVFADPAAKTFGFLDLGGASTQIAFEVPSTLNDETLASVSIRLRDNTVKQRQIFSASFNGFGVTEARKKYVNNLRNPPNPATTPATHPTDDPCLPLGFMDSESSLKGTGDFEQCYKNIKPLLDAEAKCPDKECFFAGVPKPATPIPETPFVGVSQYYFTPEQFFLDMATVEEYDKDTLYPAAKGMCEQPWTKPNDPPRCFEAAWLMNLLSEGYKFSNTDGHRTKVSPVKTIDGKEVSWTLGVAFDHIMEDPANIPPITPPTPTVPETHEKVKEKVKEEPSVTDAKSKEPNAGVVIALLLLIVGFVVILVRSSWFQENFWGGNAVRSWLSGRDSNANYFSLNPRSTAQDLESGRYGNNSSSSPAVLRDTSRFSPRSSSTIMFK